MHLAILRTGETNARISAHFPDYPDLFVALLNQHSDKQTPEFSFTSFAVFESMLPENVTDFDGYILTGSAAGVYEKHSWLDPLFNFIRACDSAKIPVCGICFGHQAVAQALGGEVVKWPHGWGVGVRQMQVTTPIKWCPERTEFDLIYFHQDQVTKLPDGAIHHASSEFCEVGAFSKGQHIFCLQGHPEFTPDYSKALLHAIKDKVGEEQTNQALASLSNPNDGAVFAKAIARFFKQAQPR